MYVVKFVSPLLILNKINKKIKYGLPEWLQLAIELHEDQRL